LRPHRRIISAMTNFNQGRRQMKKFSRGSSALMRALIAAGCLLVTLGASVSAHAAGRVALVIGNGAYKHVKKLENAPSDAHAMAALLRSVGFDVIEGEDLSRDLMTSRMLEFSKKAQGADLAIFYYAGQGIAVDGVNYAMGVDADIKTVMDVKLGEAINLDDALDQITSGANTKLMFLDMSRTNPFGSMVATGRDVHMASGLAERREAARSLIGFAAGPGESALDGPKGGHSPFTQALLDNIAKPGLEIQQAMTLVRAQVHDQTNGRQLAWGNSNLVGAVYLNPAAPGK
jgi:uncharacterized caspase-like protein